MREVNIMTILTGDKFIKIAENVKPDAKKRVILAKTASNQGITYHVYVNESGQILLDPQVSIPASELWVFKNKHVLDSIDKGMTESAAGKIVKRGPFAKYVRK